MISQLMSLLKAHTATTRLGDIQNLDMLVTTIKGTWSFTKRRGPGSPQKLTTLSDEMSCCPPQAASAPGMEGDPSHCCMLYITHFVLLGYSTSHKSRLCASKWVYPTAVYIKSDKALLKRTVLPVPRHPPLDSLHPSDELSQGPMSQVRMTTTEELNSSCQRRMDMRRHYVCMVVKQIHPYCY